MNHNEHTRFITWIIISCISFVVGFILIIGYFRFKGMMRLMIVQKRYPKIVLLESQISIFVTFIWVPLYQVSHCQLEIFSDSQNIIDIVTFLIYPAGHALIVCEVCRLWLICFDINYSHSVKNSGWKSQINNKFSQKNWWMKNKKTLGNYQYVTRRFIYWWIISGTFCMLLFQIFGNNQWVQFIDGTIYGVPIMLVIYAYYKCPKVGKDKFLFELEFKSTVSIFTSALIFYFLNLILWFFDIFIAKSYNSLDGLYAFSAVSILSTLWIPNKILSKMIWWDEHHDKMSIMIISHDIMTQILSNKHDLELFALHLNDEFSLEIILSFIEMIQFKKYFDEICFNKKYKYVMLKSLKIEFDFDTPLNSTIVYDTFKNDIDNGFNVTNMEMDIVIINNFKTVAYLLYEKYIKEDSELEVNIPFSCRNIYNVLMGNKTHWINEHKILSNDLLNIFDPICLEMFTLMQHSLSRCKQSGDFITITEIPSAS